jgi:DNA gyrase subunit A
MATNIPPHNLGEICDALCLVLDEPECTAESLMRIVRGPDFPTAGIIYGTSGIRDAYETGRGLITVRARVEIETNERTGRDRILVSELPYQVNKAALLEKVAHLVKGGVIPGIADIRDESDRNGMRVVFDIKKDAASQIVLNQLYKHTAMQSTFGANMVALVDMQPRQLTLKQLIEQFLLHRREVVLRRTRFELDEKEARAHIVEGLRKALDHIDAIIETIRSAPDVPAARTSLMGNFELTEIQANAILEMRLARLTGLERKKLDEEYAELLQEIERLKGILGSDAKVRAVIREEILEIRQGFADERRTEIVARDAGDFEAEDLIPDEDVVVTITHLGYIKRMPLTTYRAQRRGGRGKMGATAREEDWAQEIFIASTHAYMLFFTDRGRCYWLKVHAIPQAGRTARGKAIVNCIQIGSDERVTAYAQVPAFDDDHFLVMTTAKGQIKKTPLTGFSNPRRAGIRAVNLDEGDTLIGAAITDGTKEIMLATRSGRAVRFNEKALRPMGRVAGGVRGVTLADGDDRVVGMVVVPANHEEAEITLLTITDFGYGKRTPISEYRLTHRGGKGVLNIRVTAKNGRVISIQAVSPKDQVMIITSGGIVIRTNVSDVSVYGRATQGVRVIAVDEGSTVTDVARIPKGEDKDDRNGASGPGDEGDDDGTRTDGAVSRSRAQGAEVAEDVRAFADELIDEDDDGSSPTDGTEAGNEDEDDGTTDPA